MFVLNLHLHNDVLMCLVVALQVGGVILAVSVSYEVFVRSLRIRNGVLMCLVFATQVGGVILAVNVSY